MFQNLVDCAIYGDSVDKLTGSVLIKRAELAPNTCVNCTA